MKRTNITTLTTLAAAVLLLPSPGGAQAAGLDLGVYGGATVSTPWFEAGASSPRAGEDIGIGFAPVLGVSATLWATPRVGVRLHGMWLPSDIERGDGSALGLHTYAADVNAVFRPFTGSRNHWRSSAYLFAGAGFLRVHVRDEATPGGDPNGRGCELLEHGACLARDADRATVGQGVLGIGADVARLGRTTALFVELGLHGYDSPVHTHCHFIGRCIEGGRDYELAVTSRLVAGLHWAPAASRPAAPVPLPPPAAPPIAPPPPNPRRTITLCVVEEGALREVVAELDLTTGDTTVAGRPFRASARGYAAGEGWFMRDEPIAAEGRTYLKAGVPAILSATRLTLAGEYRGVPLFRDRSDAGEDRIYVAIQPGCTFQAYQEETELRRVRG